MKRQLKCLICDLSLHPLHKISTWLLSAFTRMSPSSGSSPEPEKHSVKQHATPSKEDPERILGDISDIEDHEVFKRNADVDFRTVGWPRATFIFLKVIFATGVLSIPLAMYSLGAIGGALSVLGWGALNTYTGVIQGDFRVSGKNDTSSDRNGSHVRLRAEQTL